MPVWDWFRSTWWSVGGFLELDFSLSTQKSNEENHVWPHFLVFFFFSLFANAVWYFSIWYITNMCRISLLMLEHSVLSVLFNQNRQTDKNMGRTLVDGFPGCLCLFDFCILYVNMHSYKDSFGLSLITLRWVDLKCSRHLANVNI